MWPWASDAYYHSGYSPLGPHHLRMSHGCGSSQGRGQAISPIGLIAPREQGVRMRTMTTEHTTLSSLNREIIAQSCMSISCKDTTISVEKKK